MAITRKQKELMDEFFEGSSEEDALEKCKLTRGIYIQWINSPEWIKEFDLRIEALKKQTSTIIAKFQPVAALKLIALLDSEKSETARHACLDVIRLGTGLDVEIEDEPEDEKLKGLNNYTIKKIREVLAKNEKQN